MVAATLETKTALVNTPETLSLNIKVYGENLTLFQSLSIEIWISEKRYK